MKEGVIMCSIFRSLANKKIETFLLIIGLIMATIILIIGIYRSQDDYFYVKDKNIEKNIAEISVAYKGESYTENVVKDIVGKRPERYNIYIKDFGIQIGKKTAMLKVTFTDIAYKYPIIEGRALTYKELCDENKVILGRNFSEYIYEENKEKYIDIMGNKYKVAAIVGREKFMSDFNNMFIMPFDIIPKELKDKLINSKMLKLAISSDREIDSTYIDDIKKDIKKYEKTDLLVEYDTSENIAEAFLHMTKNTFGKIIQVYIVCFLSIFISLYFWILDKRKDIALKFAIGGSRIKIYLEIIKETTIVAILGYLVTMILCPLIVGFIDRTFKITISLNLVNVLGSISILILSIIIITAIAITMIMRHDIVTILKE